MAKVRNTRKGFNFKIEIDGINQFEVQKFTPPEVEVEVVKHAGANKDQKTAGRVVIGEAKLEKVIPAPGSDKWAWDWLLQAQNPRTGTGGLKEDYGRIIVVKEMHPNGQTALNTWILEDAWCSKLSQSDYDRATSDNIIQTMTLQVDELDRV